MGDMPSMKDASQEERRQVVYQYLAGEKSSSESTEKGEAGQNTGQPQVSVNNE